MNVEKKNILFIGITNYDLRSESSHLAKKFEGLSNIFRVYSIARGKPLRVNKWKSDFYLAPFRFIFPAFAFFVGCYLCATKKINAIVCQGPLAEGFIGALLKFAFRKELIIEIHGDWREGPFINKKRLFKPILRRLTPIFATWSFRSADKIRSVAEYYLRDLRKEYPNKKYFVFPTYSDLDIFLKENKTEFKQYICTAAVLSPIKNIETLIDAFVSLREIPRREKKIYTKLRAFKLVIVGDGPSLEGLKLKVKNKKFSDFIVFTGKLSQEEVKNIIKDCYVFVLPSLSEGLPRVLLEAMALSKPIIASNVGGVPEVVSDGISGFLFKPKDVQRLSNRLEYLIEEPELAKKMGEMGYSFVKAKFSNERYTQNFKLMICNL